ncbi:hypothetical protein DsansV1_C35g0230481 [Dioscorea sansibarensis]
MDSSQDTWSSDCADGEIKRESFSKDQPVLVWSSDQYPPDAALHGIAHHPCIIHCNPVLSIHK